MLELHLNKHGTMLSPPLLPPSRYTHSSLFRFNTFIPFSLCLLPKFQLFYKVLNTSIQKFLNGQITSLPTEHQT